MLFPRTASHRPAADKRGDESIIILLSEHRRCLPVRDHPRERRRRNGNGMDLVRISVFWFYAAGKSILIIQHYTYAQFRIYVTESLEPFERILQTVWLVGVMDGHTSQCISYFQGAIIFNSIICEKQKVINGLDAVSNVTLRLNEFAKLNANNYGITSVFTPTLQRKLYVIQNLSIFALHLLGSRAYNNGCHNKSHTRRLYLKFIIN